MMLPSELAFHLWDAANDLQATLSRLHAGGDLPPDRFQDLSALVRPIIHEAQRLRRADATDPAQVDALTAVWDALQGYVRACGVTWEGQRS